MQNLSGFFYILNINQTGNFRFRSGDQLDANLIFSEELKNFCGDTVRIPHPGAGQDDLDVVAVKVCIDFRADGFECGSAGDNVTHALFRDGEG